MNRPAFLLPTLAGAPLVVVGTMVFASGQNEGAPGSPFFAPPSGTNNVATLTGTVSLTNRIHPVLTSGSPRFELLVPRFAVYESGVKDGQSIMVKGYTVNASEVGPWLRSDEGPANATYFVVTSATIDGKDYNPWAAGPRYGYGPGRGYGPDHGYGPGRGYRPGPGYGRDPGYGPGVMGWW